MWDFRRMHADTRATGEMQTERSTGSGAQLLLLLWPVRALRFP